MEWDPWFEQGDWELEQKPLHARKQESKKFAKCRAAAKKLETGGLGVRLSYLARRFHKHVWLFLLIHCWKRVVLVGQQPGLCHSAVHVQFPGEFNSAENDIVLRKRFHPLLFQEDGRVLLVVEHCHLKATHHRAWCPPFLGRNPLFVAMCSRQMQIDLRFDDGTNKLGVT